MQADGQLAARELLQDWLARLVGGYNAILLGPGRVTSAAQVTSALPLHRLHLPSCCSGPLTLAASLSAHACSTYHTMLHIHSESSSTGASRKLPFFV